MNTRIDRETAASIVLALFPSDDAGYHRGLTEKESTMADICKLFGAKYDEHQRWVFPDGSAIGDCPDGTYCHTLALGDRGWS